jgi:polyphosphate kinase
MGSADLMPRNLDRRVEILFPIQDAAIVRRLRDSVLKRCLADNRKARLGKSNGTYEFMPVEGAGSVDSQGWFIEHRGTPTG